MIDQKIDKLKSNLCKWQKDFLDNLLKKQNTTIQLFLAEECWLIKYINSINNKKIKSDSLNDIIELKNKFESGSISDLPQILILNKSSYTSLPDDLTNKFINLKGTFYNKLLLIDLKKSNIYCIFFKDNQGNLRQGYLKINKDDDYEIINKFKKEEPLNLLKELGIEISDYSNGKKDDKFCLRIFNISKNNFFKLDFKIKNTINSKTIIIPKPEFIKINNNGLEIIDESDEKKSKTLIEKMNKKEYKIKNIVYKNEINEIPLPNKTNIRKKNENVIKNNVKSNLNSFKSNEDLINFRPKKSIIKRNPSSNVAISRNRSFGLKLIDFLPNKSFHKEISLTPGLVGLQKSGGFIYLNAILQSLSNIGRLRIYLLTKDIYEDLKNNQNKKISFALAEVLYNIWIKPNKKSFSPNIIKKAIYDTNPCYIKTPKDLIQLLLDNIHRELNYLQNKPDILNNIKIETNNNYINSKKNSSIIVDEFYGFIANEIICEKCSNISYIYEEIKIISFSLEEIGKYMSKKDINISDCFNFYTRKEKSTQETCQNCHNFLSKEIKIMNTPKTLIINFDRKDNIEGNIKIVPEEYLDLKKYLSNSKSFFFYELKGIICKDERGNFIAYCKNSDNCEWYKYNDENVSKVYFSEVKGARLPYVLFYNYISA